ncbi:MAG: nucleotidyltransferase family protein [Legionellaceae bacterium]|nr:nucleotidyltransferase family protein [Legionellaceae bacterium]
MKTAMILAAGRGERLKPLTDFCPKALCAIQNTPLIEHHLIKLARAGFLRVIINHAYLGGKIRQYLGQGEQFGLEIMYSPEPPGGLETGGGIVNALSLLGNEPFITINADIFTNYDFSLLKSPKSSLAHVVLVNKPTYSESGDFGLSSTHFIHNIEKKYTFSGIAYYHPEVFKTYKPGRYSMGPLLRSMAANNQVSGEIHAGTWFDIGSIERLRLAEESTATMRECQNSNSHH